MRFTTASSPHLSVADNVGAIMRRVSYALLPGVAVLVWLFGWGVLINLALAITTAVTLEALILFIRSRPVLPALSDSSAILTAALLAVALPPLSPWWLTVLGVVFAIVIAKQLYGGLGYNLFNPAMVGYVVLLISFPLEMSSWPEPGLWRQVLPGFDQTLNVVTTGQIPGGIGWDGLTGATPLDAARTGSAAELAGGWVWLNLAFLVGGLWLVYRQTAAWQIPSALLAALTAISTVFYLLDPQSYGAPWFHLFSGATMLGAFFIATDPVTASTTYRGRLLYGAGIGVLIYIIRTFGGYPDGVAFAVLLMNITVPTIDYYTQPRVFGARSG